MDQTGGFMDEGQESDGGILGANRGSDDDLQPLVNNSIAEEKSPSEQRLALHQHYDGESDEDGQGITPHQPKMRPAKATKTSQPEDFHSGYPQTYNPPDDGSNRKGGPDSGSTGQIQN